MDLLANNAHHIPSNLRRIRTGDFYRTTRHCNRSIDGQPIVDAIVPTLGLSAILAVAVFAGGNLDGNNKSSYYNAHTAPQFPVETIDMPAPAVIPHERFEI